MPSETEEQPKKIAWVNQDPDDPEFASIRKMFEEMGLEVRQSEVIGCPGCGFLVTTAKATGAVVQTMCVCQLRKEHDVRCRLLNAAEMKFDIGCVCENNDQTCPKCWACTCGGKTDPPPEGP